MADAEALFAEHQSRLYRYLCRAVGHSETARDLTQDVFLRVVRAPGPLPGDDRERRAWIFRIARNLAIDHHRRQVLRPVADVDPATAARPAGQDTAAAVNQALAALGDLDRDVFLMRELGGLSYDEIARACDLSADAVRSRIHRARLALRDRLARPIAATRSQPLKSRFPHD